MQRHADADADSTSGFRPRVPDSLTTYSVRPRDAEVGRDRIVGEAECDERLDQPVAGLGERRRESQVHRLLDRAFDAFAVRFDLLDVRTEELRARV